MTIKKKKKKTYELSPCQSSWVEFHLTQDDYLAYAGIKKKKKNQDSKAENGFRFQAHSCESK